MLELAVLGLLKDQDMHGYELRGRLADLLGMSKGVSFGSLYPALARLLSAGAVQVLTTPHPRPGREGGRTGRRRKVYSMTPAGTALFERLLARASEEAADERSFSVALAFAAHLPPERRLSMLQRRRSALAARLTELAARQGRGGRYAELVSERERDRLSRDVSWLEALIDEEQGDLVRHPGRPSPPRRRPVPLASASQLRRGRGSAALAGS